MLKKFYYVCFFYGLVISPLAAQTSDEAIFQSIYAESLQNQQAYAWLDHLCNQIGGRLSGSPQMDKAIEFTKAELEKLGVDKVWLQPVQVPHWQRGDKEVGQMIVQGQPISVPVCALGGSVATPAGGLQAEVVEVQSFDELAVLGAGRVSGKIVFFNKIMSPLPIETFEAYGQTGNIRRQGASEAAKYGAVGVIVRSLTTAYDDFPHTGSMAYQLNVPKIPAIAISTNGAELLHKTLAENPQTPFFMQTSCQTLPDKLSYNVIADWYGSDFPGEVVLVGGHLDSWDLAQGAHDDGAGVVQSMEVLRLFKTLGIQPKRTIRVVLFANEENGLRGGVGYAEWAAANAQRHTAAIESDAGGFTPRGFTVENDGGKLATLQTWLPLFEPYLLHYIKKGGGGADISPLRNQGVVLIGLRPDSQRYFDYHHTTVDTFDKVNSRELQLGAATLAGLVYLLSTYGL